MLFFEKLTENNNEKKILEFNRFPLHLIVPAN